MTDKEIPEELWLDCKINGAGYFQVGQFSKRELTSIPVSDFQRIKYIRATNRPEKPHSSNDKHQAALDALREVKESLQEAKLTYEVVNTLGETKTKLSTADLEKSILIINSVLGEQCNKN